MKTILLILFVSLFLGACNQNNPLKNLKKLKENEAFVRAMIQEPDNFFYIDIQHYPKNRKTLPVGIFDSGIGGLTVMDAVINYDNYNNSDKTEGSDGVKDFINEGFIYLADQANMPYSNYAEVGKENLLAENVLKDVQFLLGNKYYLSNTDEKYQTDKLPVKAIVIACNTATAYGKAKIDELMEVTGLNIKVIGVIDAGCLGAAEALKNDENGVVAIFATPATVASGAYPRTLQKILKERNYQGKIETVQQGGKGLHESIDADLQFIDKNRTKVSAGYIGPSLQNEKFPLKKELLQAYNFNPAKNGILFNKNDLQSSDTIQINSVENYVRYHIVSLLEKIREKNADLPLKSIILGCTHYPYVEDTIHTVLNELRNLEINGKKPYARILKDKVLLIDPAKNTAKELFEYLNKNNLFCAENEKQLKTDQFYISMANLTNPEVKTKNGKLTYNYKYIERKANNIQQYVKRVPFSTQSIQADIFENIKNRLPETYRDIEGYMQLGK